MRIAGIHLRDFRNYERLDMEVPGRLTILCGHNAVGKTNIVESLQLLTAGQSFRHARSVDMVRAGQPHAYASVDLTDGNRRLESALALEEKSRKYSLNGKPKRVADMRGIAPSVTFTPDDLDLIKGPPGARRTALDSLGVQLNRNYQVILQDFEKVLQSRNRLLKDGHVEMLDALNDVYVKVSVQLQNYRAALFARLEPKIAAYYAQLSGGEGLHGCYVPSGQAQTESDPSDPTQLVEHIDLPTSEQHLLEDEQDVSRETSAQDDSPETLFRLSEIEVMEDVSRETSSAHPEHAEHRKDGAHEALERSVEKEALESALAAHREAEVGARRTLVGPSRDRIDFLINGMHAGKFASQGQQRSAVLAWKLAEADVIEEMLSTAPILLLDDVMSELDATRRTALMAYLQHASQAFITTANMDYFDEETLQDAHIVQLPLETA